MVVNLTKNHKISAVIITFNEERYIGQCIDALKDVVDEIVVIDSFSSDKTEKISRQKNVVFIQQKWEGYSSTKNIGNQLAKHTYILSVDADEKPDEKLKSEILSLKKAGFNGSYSVSRKNYYGNYWVRHCGWYPDKKIRIFNKYESKWTGDFVHETLKTPRNGTVYELKGNIEHYTISDNKHHLQTIHKYAKLAAQNAINNNKSLSLWWAIRSYITTFIKIYFIKKGILDGVIGLRIAINSGYSKWLRYKYYNNLKIQS